MLWISEPDVTELLDLEGAIEAEEAMLAQEAAGKASNLTKALGQRDGVALHALGSMAPAMGFVGFKTWAHTKHGAGTIFELFDAERGTLLAIIETVALSQLRTAAISGVATRWLAKSDADEMALIGTGKQAMLQVAAVAAARPLKRLRVFSPTKEKREDFARRAGEIFVFPVEAKDSIEEATDNAPIVTIVTRAKDPFFHASALAKGAHVNAIGAILRGYAEFHQDVFDRAGLVVVDNLDNVKSISNEFIERYEKGGRPWSEVRSLAEIVAAGKPRPAGCDVSLFKALGMGTADLALCAAIYEKAVERGMGHEVPAKGRSQARWRSSRRQAK